MDCCTLGWELPHPDIPAITPASADPLARADLVFLSTAAIETCWERARGDGLRKFASVRSERPAWRRLVSLVRQLRRLLRRGGRLVCRLDAVGSQCQVRHSPGPACFPTEEVITAYSVLARVHPALEYWNRALQPVTGSELSLVSQDHPFRNYLREFRGALAPQVAVPEIHAHALPLAITTGDEVVACAESQLVLLPPTAASDPRHEADFLLQAARALMKEAGGGAVPAASHVPGIGALRQRELVLERQMHKLLAKRDRLRSEIERRQLLAGLVEYSDPGQLAAAAGEALRILGLTAPQFALLGRSLEVTVERVDGDGQPAYILDGHMGLRPASRTAAKSPLLTILTQDAPENLDHEDRPLIPADQLYLAVSAVLREPRNKPLRRQLAQSLNECRGRYRYEPTRTLTG